LRKLSREVEKLVISTGYQIEKNDAQSIGIAYTVQDEYKKDLPGLTAEKKTPFGGASEEVISYGR
jgi:hypothetical protein